MEESIAGSGTRAEPLEAAVQSNGKDNLLTSTVAPVVVPDSLPPRHQTYLPASTPPASFLHEPRLNPRDPMNSDPITATPSQRKCHHDSIPSRPAALQHEPALLEERPKKDAVDKMPGHVPSAPLRAKPVQTSAASSKGSEPPIHAALKRSSALSANDNTEICIDITGDQEEIEQEGLIGGSSDGTGSNAAVPARFASLAPFLHASEKWFSNFDPNLQQLLATRANSLRYTVNTFPV